MSSLLVSPPVLFLLAVTVSMLYVDPVDPDNTLGWAGIYYSPVQVEGLFRDGFED